MLDWLIGKIEKRLAKKRAYEAGKIDRLTSNWTSSRKNHDSEVRFSLKTMVTRSRLLSQNNDYARKYLKLVPNNVVGPAGIKLQNRATNPDGTQDRAANKEIEAAFVKWGLKYASVCGKLTWNDINRIYIETMARDGEVLVRIVKGFDNAFGFALQIIECDYLDEELNVELRSGNSIRLGIEFDRWKRPVAYYLLTTHPGSDTFVFSGRRYERISAEEIIHGFQCERPEQSRGVPWMHTAMTRLNHLGGYEESELIAARTGASTMGAIETPLGDDEVASDNEMGDMEVEPGIWRQLPKGKKLIQYDPTHPAGNFDPFMKRMLKGISSGLLVSYPSLGSDLEGVNLSSIRHGVMDERDNWKILQTMVINQLCHRIYPEWLLMAITTQQVDISITEFDRVNKPTWQPRGWHWFDPVKDVKAAILGINEKLTTRTQVIAERGGDIEDVFETLAAEDAIAEANGLILKEETPGNVTDSEDKEEENGPKNKNRQALSVV